MAALCVSTEELSNLISGGWPTKYTNAFIEWFSGLSQGPQLGDRTFDLFSALRDWFIALSQNQQYVVLLIFVITLFVVFSICKLLSRFFISIRRWYRRKRIPAILTYGSIETYRQMQAESNAMVLMGN